MWCVQCLSSSHTGMNIPYSSNQQATIIFHYMRKIALIVSILKVNSEQC